MLTEHDLPGLECTCPQCCYERKHPQLVRSAPPDDLVRPVVVPAEPAWRPADRSAP